MPRNKWFLNKYSRALENRAEDALNVMAEHLVGECKEAAPVDTGNLQNSITWTRPKRLTRYVGTSVDYAIHVEFGHHKVPPKSFLREPLDENREDLQEFFNNTMLEQ